MEKDNSRFESVYTSKVRAGRRRTYFFDVRKTKGDDFYITITESTKKFNGDGYERHKIFLYKEDFNRFLTSMEDTINHVKTELMPDYDYDEFTKKQAEWERQKALEAEQEAQAQSETPTPENSEPVEEAPTEEAASDSSATETESATESPAEPESTESEGGDGEVSSEDDMSW